MPIISFIIIPLYCATIFLNYLLPSTFVTRVCFSRAPGTAVRVPGMLKSNFAGFERYGVAHAQSDPRNSGNGNGSTVPVC